MGAQVVNPLAVLDAAATTFDNLRFERRNSWDAPTQNTHWTRRIAETNEARAAVAGAEYALRQTEEWIANHVPECEGREWNLANVRDALLPFKTDPEP